MIGISVLAANLDFKISVILHTLFGEFCEFAPIEPPANLKNDVTLTINQLHAEISDEEMTNDRTFALKLNPNYSDEK